VPIPNSKVHDNILLCCLCQRTNVCRLLLAGELQATHTARQKEGEREGRVKYRTKGGVDMSMGFSRGTEQLSKVLSPS